MNSFAKIIVSIFILSLVFNPLGAKETWNLQMCIEHALKNNLDIKRQKVQVEQQEILLETQKYRRLPNLTGAATQKLDFGRSLNRENTYADVNSQSSSFYLTTEVPLFTGFNITNSVAKQRLELKVHSATLEKTENDIALQVASYYYQILLNKEISGIAEEQIKLSKELEEITVLLSQHGKVPESQILEIQAQVANDELQAVIARNTLQLSLVDLAQLIELREAGELDIATVPEETIAPPLNNPEYIFRIAKNSMPEIMAAEYSTQSYEKSVRIAKSGYYPTLSLEAGLNSGYYYFSNTVNSSFNDQINNNLQKTIYLTLRIPIFNRLSTRNSVRAAKKDLENSRIIAEDTEKTLYKEIQKAYYDATAAWEKYSATQKAVISNTEALRYAQEKYNAGKSTTYEFNEAKIKLANSLSEQAQAKYEFILQNFLLNFYMGNQITDN